VLVTLTAGALAYEFLLKPLFALGNSVPSLLTSIAWSIGGIAVLWLILVELLRHTRFPWQRGGRVRAGGPVRDQRRVRHHRPARPVPFGRRARPRLGRGAIAARRRRGRGARRRAADRGGGARTISGNAARIAALVIGLAGIGAVAIKNALSAEPDVGSAVLVALAVVIIGLRLIHSTRADRRYAALLESEVASQTRSLMDSLAATAAAERNLRLLMNAVPDSIVWSIARAASSNPTAYARHGGAVRTTGKPQHLRVPGLRRGGVSGRSWRRHSTVRSSASRFPSRATTAPTGCAALYAPIREAAGSPGS